MIYEALILTIMECFVAGVSTSDKLMLLQDAWHVLINTHRWFNCECVQFISKWTSLYVAVFNRGFPFFIISYEFHINIVDENYLPCWLLQLFVV
jgi:hypothetical protein